VYFLQGAEQWIIASHIGAKALANYFIAAQLGLAVSLAIEPFKMWWFARRHRAVSEPAINNSLYSVLGAELACLSALMIMLTMPFVLSYLVPASYLEAIDWLHWVCVICVLRQQSEFMNLGCYVKWDGKSPLLINIVSATAMIVTALLLVEIYGLKGILMAMLVANIIRTALFHFVSQFLLNQNYALSRVALMWIWLSLAFYAAETKFTSVLCLVTFVHCISLIFGYYSLVKSPIALLFKRSSPALKQGAPHA
jgi:hypothetical protein